MRITTIIENSLGDNKNLHNEHGISFFIETDNGNILFDTGKSGDFIENAKKLNIDLNNTDYLVLSHAHYDHCGGVKKFLESFNVKPKMYVGSKFFINSDKYHRLFDGQKSDFSSHNSHNSHNEKYRYIGINFDKKFIEDKGLKINYVSDYTDITDNIKVFTNFNKIYDFEKLNPNMMIRKGEKYVVDPFEDEIVLTIETPKGVLILLGCSHPGILNIVSDVKERTGKNIYGILGGTHLVEASEDRIEKTIKKLKEMDIKLIGVSHCTGDKAVDMFKIECDGFFINNTGTVINKL